MKQSGPRVFRDADNFPLATSCYERFADRAFARPMATRQCFIDDDDGLVVAGILFSECAARQQRDAERGKVVWLNGVARGANRRGSSPDDRGAIQLPNGRAAIIQIVTGLSRIVVKWLVHQRYMADPYGAFHWRRGEEAFPQFTLKLRGSGFVVIVRTGRIESELRGRKILRFKARIKLHHAQQ